MLLKSNKKRKSHSPRMCPSSCRAIVFALGRTLFQNAGELSRPGRGWPSSTGTEFRHAEGQENQDRHLPSAEVGNAVPGRDGRARRRHCHGRRDKRRGQSAGFKKDNEGGLPRGELGQRTTF